MAQNQNDTDDQNILLDIDDIDENQVDPTSDWKSPNLQDEEDISGSAPSPDSDDDVLENAADMGIGIDDQERVRELNIANDVELAEKSRRGID